MDKRLIIIDGNSIINRAFYALPDMTNNIWVYNKIYKYIILKNIGVINLDKRLIIIDGNSIINRAFYALPDMTNSEGLHTNAIYGFTRMLFKIIDDYKPTHISVAFDMKAPTFRHKEFSEYKAGRKKMPGELGQQLQPLKELLDKFDIHRMEMAGYEADDLIGTVSKMGEDNGFKVYIVTGDKDAIQLASDKTTTLITKKGVGEVEEYNYDSVIERYEMTPTQFIDLKGLMGDKSDNIPGVPGIGEKTGIKLIKEFSSVENLIENTEQLKGSVKKKIEENKEQAIFSKKLATIMRDVPIEISLDELAYGDYDKNAVIEEFKKFGFNTLIKQVLSMDSGSEECSVEEKIELNIVPLENVEEFKKEVEKNNKLFIKTVKKVGNILDKNILCVFVSSLEELAYGDYDKNAVIEEFKKFGFNTLIKQVLSMDSGSEECSVEEKIELNIVPLENVEELKKEVEKTNKLFIKTVKKVGNILDKNILCVFVSANGEDIYYLNDEKLELVKDLLINEEIKKIGYNLKDDYLALKSYNIEMNNIFFDIAIGEYLIDSKSSTSYECSDIAMKYLTKKIKSEEDILGKGAKAKKFQDLDMEELSTYFGEIINIVYNVYPIMEKTFKDMDMEYLFYDVEMPLVEVLGSMEYCGMAVDKNQLNELGDKFKSIIANLEEEIFSMAGEKFNINSPKQLGVILFEKLELPVVKKTKTGYSTNADVLEKLRDKHEIIDKITEYRQIVKLNSTYVR